MNEISFALDRCHFYVISLLRTSLVHLLLLH